MSEEDFDKVAEAVRLLNSVSKEQSQPVASTSASGPSSSGTGLDSKSCIIILI